MPAPAWAAFAVALALLFGPVLLGGQLLLPLDNLRGQAPFRQLAPTDPHGNPLQGDLITLVTPSLAEVRRAYDAGRWPLWNPLVGTGMPLLADPQAQALQPLALLAFPLPLLRAAAVTAALRVLVALVFAFLLLRRQGAGTGPALAGAFAYGLGGFLVLWVGWPLANAAAWLPAVLYALVRVARGGERRDVLLLAAALWGLLLAGHPEAMAYALGLAAVFAASLARERPPELRPRFLRGAGLALLLAGAAAAPALLPALDYLPQSLRAERLAEGSLAPPKAGSAAPERWVPLVAPNAFGNNRYAQYWGFSNTNEDAAGFAGTATLLLALLALGGKPRLPQERVVLGAGLVALLWVVLGEPLETRRPLLLVSFALAYLAACTLERWSRSRGPVAPVLLAAAALAAILVWATMTFRHPEAPETLAVLRWGWLHWQTRFLALAALVLLLARGRRWAPTVVAGLIAAELLLLHLPAHPPMPRRLALPKTESIRFLQREVGNDRMAALGASFPPNLPALYGLTDARLYNPLAPRAYVALTAPVRVGWDGEVPVWGRAEHPLYRTLGIRWLLTGPEERAPAPWALAFRDASAAVWRRPRALRRLHLSDRPRGAGVRWFELEANRMTARLRLPAPGRLGSNVYQDGNWRLLVDGHRHPASPAETLLGAPLPAGARRLDLLYRPRAFLAGMALAAAALAVAALWLLPPPKFVRSR
ncbi:MAG TPA: hypothetical protein VF121_07045 [Thermoanaerobaculia bacterium]|nr:hypothetical protein [Thermoanaerobaculia bacterium]